MRDKFRLRVELSGGDEEKSNSRGTSRLEILVGR